MPKLGVLFEETGASTGPFFGNVSFDSEAGAQESIRGEHLYFEGFEPCTTGDCVEFSLLASEVYSRMVCLRVFLFVGMLWDMFPGGHIMLSFGSKRLAVGELSDPDDRIDALSLGYNEGMLFVNDLDQTVMSRFVHSNPFISLLYQYLSEFNKDHILTM